jgi:TAR DNA-binding protein 43
LILGGAGLNLNALPMNPAFVAAALNQWGSAMGGLLNGMQNQGNNDQVSALNDHRQSKVDVHNANLFAFSLSSLWS